MVGYSVFRWPSVEGNTPSRLIGISRIDPITWVLDTRTREGKFEKRKKDGKRYENFETSVLLLNCVGKVQKEK